MEGITLFFLDKIINISAFICRWIFRRKIFLSPKSQLVSAKGNIECRYSICITNKTDNPYYNLNLVVIGIIRDPMVNILVSPDQEGMPHKPRYTLSVYHPQFGQPVVEMGYIGLFTNQGGRPVFNLRIHSIDPLETMRFEVIIKNVHNLQRFRVKHKLTYSKKEVPIQVKKYANSNSLSISVQGLGWKARKK